MDNFDLKKYLVENKVTTNSKMMNEEVDSLEIADRLSSLPDFTQEYFAQNGLGEYVDSLDEPGVAFDILDKLGKDKIPTYKEIPSGQDQGVENYLYYDLGDGYILGTEDYEYAYPKIYKKADLDKLI
jgi:hypothetical protein